MLNEESSDIVEAITPANDTKHTEMFTKQSTTGNRKLHRSKKRRKRKRPV